MQKRWTKEAEIQQKKNGENEEGEKLKLGKHKAVNVATIYPLLAFRNSDGDRTRGRPPSVVHGSYPNGVNSTEQVQAVVETEEVIGLDAAGENSSLRPIAVPELEFLEHRRR